MSADQTVYTRKHLSVKSLLRFRERFKSRIGGCYIIHPRNLVVREEENILCIPPYMTICL